MSPWVVGSSNITGTELTRMINAHGPTEEYCFATEFWIDKQVQQHPDPVSHSGTSAASVVDENMRKRLPVGAESELYGLTSDRKRYHNLHEKTASVFVENPFSVCGEDKRLCRTGDMVRMKGDGKLNISEESIPR